MNSDPRGATRAATAAASDRPGGGGRRVLPRVRLLVYVALAVSAAAFAVAGSSAAREAKGLSTPSGLQAFLRTAHATRMPTASHVSVPTFSRTPAFAWNPVRGATKYQFQLSTSKTFLADNALIWASQMASPAASVPLALPWISGEPASLFWRVRALGPKGYSQWSAPGAFNMRWTQQPTPLESGPGYIRWSTVDGATGYQVWFLNANDSSLGKVISTITNVADEREYYVSDTVPSTVVYWRIRAVRSVYGSAQNSLPAFSYGPWSHVFKSTNPPPASAIRQGDEVVSTKVTRNPLDDKYARLRPLTAVSDVVSTAGHPKPHSLVPAITVGGNPTTPGNLYRIYMFTDRDCVNRVFTGYPVTSPAYAPRSSGGAVLPAGTQQMADGTPVTPTELGSPDPAAGQAAGAAADAAATATASTATSTGPAKIDLWDTRGRYFVVAIPVVAIVPAAPATGTSGAGDPTGPTGTTGATGTSGTTGTTTAAAAATGAAADPSAASAIVYQDLELPQDVCSKGRFITFGKASHTPELTSAGRPTAVGLSPSGRLLSAVHSKPAFYGSPLVTWEPASGAIGYQVQWSKSAYPWKTAGSIKTPATSATLPLKPGTWWYRVRGINDSLPGNQLMSWSAQVPVVITRPTFGVLRG